MSENYAAQFSAAPPLALYVHLPWCVRKCPYCDFNSHEFNSGEHDGSLPEQAYVDALLKDFAYELQPLAGQAVRELASIFFGGGTPSLFSGGAIQNILDGIRARHPLEADCEITLEANPGTAEAARFAAYRAAGVNRLSLGVQSLRDDRLRALGRIHGAGEAVRAVQMARAAGFDNLNVDIMYALPQDDVRDALHDLHAALALAPEHVSWYQLTLEPDTAFYRKPPAQLPDEDHIVTMETQGHALLAAHGYARYEVSAYARHDLRARHNLNYWQFGDYLGIGAGAHGKITDVKNHCIIRTSKERNPRSYMKHAGTTACSAGENITAPTRLVSEFMLNALRLVGGVPLTLFTQRSGLPVAVLQPALKQAHARGWLVDPLAGRLQPTPLGMNYLNDLINSFSTHLDTR